MSQLRIGIIGTGGMGNHHAREIKQRQDVVISAMCDASDAAMDRLAETLEDSSGSVKRYASVDAPCDDVDDDERPYGTSHDLGGRRQPRAPEDG